MVETKDKEASGPPGQVQFAVFTVDAYTGELRKRGLRVKLQERPFQLLLVLLERPGEVVTRTELRQRLWPEGTYVDFDHSISSSINKLRGALNDSATHSRYIETVGRRGYRFLADVKPVPAPSAENSAENTQDGVPVGPDFKASPLKRPWPVMVAAALLLAAVLGGYLQWSRSRSTSQVPGGRIMLAVLPFENLTGDPGQDYFSDGLTEEMITQLGRIDPARLGVVALRTSVMHYKRNPDELNQIARDLGVQYVLAGSFRRDANQVRITAKLVQAKDQTHVFAREYDRQLEHILILQGEIAREVADEIQLTLGDRQKPVAISSPAQPTLSTEDYAAYDLYLKGRYFWNKRTSEGFRKAADSFQAAIAKSRNYARPYAGLADTYALMSSYGYVPSNEFMPKARAAALKALELDEGLAEAHTSLALITENYDWDWLTAEREYRRAIQLDPNYATAHQWYAEYLGFQGRFQEALVESERARQLDPLSLIIGADNCAILYYSRQYDRAIRQCRAVLAIEPAFGRAYLVVGAYVEKRQWADALALVQTPKSNGAGTGPWNLSWEAYVYGRAGRRTEAQHALQELLKQNPPQPEPMLAMAYSGMGQRDQAIAWLQKAYSEYSSLLVDIKVNPIYDPLRDDPRFQKLLRDVRLAR